MAEEADGLPAQINLLDVMNSWISHRGYPIVSVARDYEKGTAVVRQVYTWFSLALSMYISFLISIIRVLLLRYSLCRICLSREAKPICYRQWLSVQQRFTYDQSSSDTRQPTWYVPLDYINKTSDDWLSPMKTWLHSEAELTVNNVGARDSWVVFNVNKTGWSEKKLLFFRK